MVIPPLVITEKPDYRPYYGWCVQGTDQDDRPFVDSNAVIQPSNLVNSNCYYQRPSKVLGTLPSPNRPSLIVQTYNDEEISDANSYAAEIGIEHPIHLSWLELA